MACAAAELLLDGRAAEVDAWPALTALADPDASLQADEALQQLPRFEAPRVPAGNFGPRREVMWLHVPVLIAARAQAPAVDPLVDLLPDLAHHRAGPVPWILDIAYPPLNVVDVFVYRDGRLQQHARLGSQLAVDARALPTRTLAAELKFDPGRYDVLLRVQTQSAMVVPVRFVKPEVFRYDESWQSLLHGAALGIALLLGLYSLSHWLILRDRLFAFYTATVFGGTLILISYTGLGTQFLWGGIRHPLLDGIAPLAGLITLVAGSLFCARVLSMNGRTPVFGHILHGLALIAAVALLMMLTGVLDYHGARAVATLLALPVLLTAIIASGGGVYRNEPGAIYMLIGWLCYLAGAITMALLLRGLIPASPWAVHGYQISFVVELFAWMRVLALHAQMARRRAREAIEQHRELEKLVLSDPLTGLANRRGFEMALVDAFPHARPHSMLAVFLLDLDGFKPINDRHGHAVGDALLVQVGQRLREQLRHGDLVARIGGDEFVVLARDIGELAQAQRLGDKLLGAFGNAFNIDGRRCRVGATIGFALGPGDALTPASLLERADTAMYAGKRDGRNTLRRYVEPASDAAAPANTATCVAGSGL